MAGRSNTRFSLVHPTPKRLKLRKVSDGPSIIEQFEYAQELTKNVRFVQNLIRKSRQLSANKFATAKVTEAVDLTLDEQAGDTTSGTLSVNTPIKMQPMQVPQNTQKKVSVQIRRRRSNINIINNGECLSQDDDTD